MAEQEYNIVHDLEQHYFKINVGSHCAYLAYAKVEQGALDVYRTYVPDELRGQGLAAQLAKAFLVFADQHQLQIIPTCSYMESYMRKVGRFV